MTSSAFWNQQPFCYLVTYSFNRGPKLAAYQQAANAWFKLIRASLLTAPSAQLPALRGQLRRLEGSTSDFAMMPLTNETGAFNLTASPIATIKENTPAA